MATTSMDPEERLDRSHERLSLLGSLLWAYGAGDGLTLTRADIRTFAEYLQDIQNDLEIVNKSVCTFHSMTGGDCPICRSGPDTSPVVDTVRAIGATLARTAASPRGGPRRNTPRGAQ